MRLLVTLSLIFMLAFPVLAAPNSFHYGRHPGARGGFHGPGETVRITTVAQAKSAWDDTPVVLIGHIVSRAGGDHEHYLFRDSTGEIVVDIDDKLFMGRTVTPQTTVRLYGEVDKELMERTKIDVKSFEIQ